MRRCCASYAPRKGRRKKFRTRYVQWVLQRRFACLREKTPQRYAAFTWRGKPMRQPKNLDRYAVFYKTVSFWQRPYAGKAAKVFVLAARRGKNAARNATSAQKTQPRAALEAKACDKNGCYKNGCNKKTFRRALSFDLTGEIAYNLCITTCGVCRKIQRSYLC